MQSILNKILLTTSVSKTQFSKDLGLSKSFVVNVINGKKKCSQAMYEKICELPYISIGLRNELDEAFFRELFGLENFNLVKYCIDKMEKYDKDFFFNKNIFIRKDFIANIFLSENHIHTINSKAELLEISSYFAQKCVSADNSIFYTNFDFSQTDLDHVLFGIFRDRDYSKKIDFEHLVSVYNNSSFEVMDMFFGSLKWGRALLTTKHSNEVLGNSSQFFPYYIITKDCVITFSEDCENGIVLSSESIVGYYINMFENIKTKFTPVCNIVEDEATCLGQTDIFSSMDSAKMSYGGLACLGPFCDEQILRNIAYDFPQRDQLIKMFLVHYSSLFSTPQDEYISESAYWEFVDDGNIHVVTDKYVNKCSPKDRAALLTNVINSCKSRDNLRIKLFDENKIKLPTDFTVDCFDNYSVITSIFKDEPCLAVTKNYCVTLAISNEEYFWFSEMSKNLCKYFEMRKFILSDETCIRAFERMIAKCEGLVD